MPVAGGQVGTKLKAQHEAIKAEIEKISTCLHTEVSDREFPNWRLETLWQLRDFLNDLQKHFDLEEEGGFMSGVLEVAPQKRPVVERLGREHAGAAAKLADAIGSLKALARPDSAKLAALRTSVGEVFQLLREHENAETELLLDTYLQDEGG